LRFLKSKEGEVIFAFLDDHSLVPFEAVILRHLANI